MQRFSLMAVYRSIGPDNRVVTSASDPRLHPLDVRLGGCEPDVPDTHLEARLRRPVELAAEAPPAELW